MTSPIRKVMLLSLLIVPSLAWLGSVVVPSGKASGKLSWTIHSARTQRYYATCRYRKHSCSQQLWSSNRPDRNDPRDDDKAGDSGGANLMAELLRAAQEKGIRLDKDYLVDEDDIDEEQDGSDEDIDDDDDDEPEPNIPQGAINVFLGYDPNVSEGDKLAGNVTLTNNQLYSGLRERVLDTAGGFVALTRGASEDDEDDEELETGVPKPYEPPTTVPDSDLTAGEVVILTLSAMLNNDVPTPNRGVEIFFGYSSPGSQIKNEEGLTPAEYAEFLKETEYKVLFDHQGASIDKGTYSFDGKKAFFTARLRTGSGPLDTVSVNFILSTTGVEDDACWLIDSMLIRPQSMRRRRRR